MNTPRGLPRNEEAERSVLGAVLRDHRVLDELCSVLNTEDFYDERHRRLWEAMLALQVDRLPIDPVTVADRLRRLRRFEDSGGDAYLLEVYEAVPSAAGCLGHAQLVREKALLRRLIAVSTQILEEAYADASDVPELLDRASSKIMEIAQVRRDGNVEEIGTLIPEAFEKFTEFGTRGVLGTPTGFKDLDELLRGLRRQTLVILAARPGVGKTAFALNIALHAVLGRGHPSQQVHPAVVFSLEMGKFELIQRLVCSCAMVDSNDLQRGRVSIDRLGQDVAPLYRAPLFIDDTAGINILELRARCKRLSSMLRQRGQELGLVVIDYLQLMEPPNRRGENRQTEVAQISRGLKQLAKELDCPVLALSQLSREPARGDARPRLHHLRESGAIEQDADVVMFIHPRQDGDELPPGHQPRPVEILIEKHRNGPTGEIPLLFRPQFTTFEAMSFRQEF